MYYFDNAKQQFSVEMSKALKNGNTNEFSNAILAFADAIVEEANNNPGTHSGIRKLNTTEMNFYNQLIGAMKQSNPRQAVSNLDLAIPTTILEVVTEDIRETHPLLRYIDFQNVGSASRIIMQKKSAPAAQWGSLTDEMVAELAESFEGIHTDLYKLVAFVVISNPILELGAPWIDKFIRGILSESVAIAMENAIINGTGKNQPIGMIRNVSENATIVAGEYTEKEVTAITDLELETFGSLLTRLKLAPDGTKRPLDSLIFIVNTDEYFTKIAPWVVRETKSGFFFHDKFPNPCHIIPSEAIPEGKAILGLGKQYFACICTPKNGAIEYNDSVRFFQDERVYAVRLYANGRPKDNNGFLYLDISGLTAPVDTVKISE